MALRTFLDESFPFRALVTVVDNASTDDTYARGASAWRRPCRVWRPCTCPAKAGATRCVRRGRRATPRSSPTWTSTSPPRCPALLPLVAPLLSGHRDVVDRVAPGPGRARRARARSASSSRGPTTSSSSSRCAAGSATRSAGSRRCAGTRPRSCCRWSRTTSGSSTPSSWSRRSAWACGSARSRWTGSTTPTRGCTSSRPRPTTCAASWRMLIRRPKGLRRVRSDEVAADQLLRFAGVGVVSHPRLPLPLRRLATAARAPSAPTRSPWRSPRCSTRRCTASCPAAPTVRRGAAGSSRCRWRCTP